MNDLIAGVRIKGEVLIGDKNIYAPGTDLIELRKKVGMVFQRPNPFPLPISGKCSLRAPDAPTPAGGKKPAR